MQEENPGIHRALVTDTESYRDNVILIMRSRTSYSFEMLIPKSKYAPFAMLELLEKGLRQ